MRKLFILVALLGLTVLMAVNLGAVQVSPRDSRPDGGDRSHIGDATGHANFTSHPRIELTSARITELIARKNAKTAEYQAMKGYVDGYRPSNDDNTTLTSALGTGGAGTTFTVTDGSSFPTTQTEYRLDVEVILATRSGNTLTIVSRGRPSQMGNPTAIASHATGATLWEDENGTSGDNAPFIASHAALLSQIGVTGYDLAARNALNMTMVNFAPNDRCRSLNYDRWWGLEIARAYDWTWNTLTANEKAVYSAVLRTCVQHHIDNPKEPIPPSPRSAREQLVLESYMSGNLMLGQTRMILAMAAATYGDSGNPNALDQWNAGYAQVTDLLLPSLNGGPLYGGVGPEGTEYMPDPWIFTFDIAEIIDTATINLSIWDTVDPWAVRWAKYLLYQDIPGGDNSTERVNGNTTAGSSTVTVTSTADYVVGDRIAINTGGPFHYTGITAINGTTWTIGDPATVTRSGAEISHAQKMLSFGDIENNFGNYYDMDYIGSIVQYPLVRAMYRLKTYDLTHARYLKHWYTTVHKAPSLGMTDFMYYDASITPLDYTKALPLIFSTEHERAVGVMIGRSSWAKSATFCYFLPGGYTVDHVHAHQNSYGCMRKGAWLTKENGEYFGQGNYWSGGAGGNLDDGEDWPYGAKYHNSVQTLNHSGVSFLYGGAADASKLTRSGVAADYFCGRGDASGAYTAVGFRWSNYPFPNGDDIQTVIRDACFLPGADLFWFHDRLEYAQAHPSPTRWISQWPDNPGVAGQTITLTRGSQAIQQNVLLPASAVLTEVDQNPEYTNINGYRVETVSGATASTEYGLQIIQMGDSGFSACIPSVLTTTNANIAQCRTTVFGGVKGASVALSISYTVSGKPRHILTGFAPGAHYKVTRSTNTITIATDDETNRQTATAAGVLDFTL